MGYVKHDAIAVVSFDKTELEACRSKALVLGLPVSEIVEGGTNGDASFLIAPDGSNEGYVESNRQDDARAIWKHQVMACELTDWLHVSFGGDDQEAQIRSYSKVGP